LSEAVEEIKFWGGIDSELKDLSELEKISINDDDLQAEIEEKFEKLDKKIREPNKNHLFIKAVF